MSYFGGKFKQFDEFGEQPSWHLDENGDDSYRSYMGASLSLLVFAMTAVFLYSKAMVLYKGSDITIMMSVLEGALTYEDQFTAG